MAPTYYNYQVYCITEGTHVNDGSYRLTPPTTCPNNPLHTINPEATMPIASFKTNEVVVRESTTPNGGNFLSKTVTINALGNQTTVKELTFPFPIVALISYGNTSLEHVGDVVSMSVNPKKPIASLAAPISPASNWVSQNYLEGDRVIYQGETFTCIADTDLNQPPLDANDDIQSNWWTYGYRVPLLITPDALAYVYIGYFIQVTDGVNTDSLERVLSIDSVNNYLYMENAPTNSFAAGASVKMIIYTIQDYDIGVPGRNVIGEGKIGGKGIPARTPIHITYVNNSATDKVFKAGFEYLY